MKINILSSRQKINIRRKWEGKQQDWGEGAALMWRRAAPHQGGKPMGLRNFSSLSSRTEYPGALWVLPTLLQPS